MRISSYTKYRVVSFFLTQLIIGLFLVFTIVAQPTAPWYQTKDYEPLLTNYFGVSGGTGPTVVSAAGTFRTGSSAISHTPGSTTNKYWYNQNIGIIGNSTGYAHMIYWAKGLLNTASAVGTIATFRYTTTGTVGSVSSSATTSVNPALSTTAWTRYTGYTTVNNATRIYHAAPFSTSTGNGTALVYYDDFVLYFDAGTTTDITPPSTAPSALTNNSGVLSWTNGTDAGTGVQGSLILVSSNANAVAPTLLDQGYYPTGATIGADWTVATNTATTSWTITGTPLVVAVINYDKAYNYSTAGIFSVCSITTSVSASPLTICAGATLNVDYSAVGSFAAGNVFTAQLSNSNGSFAAPVSIGTLTSISITGTISSTIPLGTAQGSGYRIRVVSGNPAVNGSDNGANILINASTAISSVINPSVCTSASAQTTSINYTAVGSPSSYTITNWSGGGFINSSGAISPVGAPVLVIVPAGVVPGNYTATLTLTGACGSVSTAITIQLFATPTFTSVAQSGTACSGQSAVISLSGLISSSVNTVFYRINAGATQTANSVSANGSGVATFSFICTSANNGQQLIIDSIKSACTLQLTSSNTFTLNISTTPPNPTGAVNGSICSAGTMNLSVAAQAGYTTNWYNTSSGGTLLLAGNNSYTTGSLPINTFNTYYAETVAVPSNGCVSIIRVPVTASVSQASLTLTSATIYRQLPVATFITNLPYSSTVGTPDKYDLSWGGAYGFATVTNADLPAGSIPLTITNATPGTYTGSIVVRNSTAGCSSASIPFVLIIVAQIQGDYGSVATGVWSAFSTTWKLYDTATGNFTTTALTLPLATNNVWINTGYTVTLDGSTHGFCKNLYVAGTLTADATTKTPRYLEVFGTVVQMLTGGFIGNAAFPTGDASSGISIIVKNLNLRITGTDGSVYLSRLYIDIAGSKLTVDRDITFTYHGTSNQGGHTVACYSVTDNDTLIVNAGKTVTFAPWASLGTTETTGDPLPTRSFTINVYGTINLQNTLAPNGGSNQTNNEINYRNSFIYGGVSGTGKVFTLNIFNGGLVNTAEIYPNGNDGVTASPGCWIYNCAVAIGNLSNINVATGGTLTVYKVADFRKPTQTVTGGGIFNLIGTARIRMGSPDGISLSGATGHIQTTTRNFSTTGTYCYEGTASQITGTGVPSVSGAMVINNTSNVTLTNTTIFTDSVLMTTGKIIIGDKNITTNLVKNGNATNYIVTNGLGALKISNIAGTGVLFPIGSDIISYNPAIINNAGTIDNISVKVKAITLPSGVQWPLGSPRSFRSIQTGLWNDPNTWELQTYRLDASVNRTWTIAEDVVGGSNVTLKLQWNAADELVGFNRNSSAVVRYNGTAIDYPTAPIGYTAAAGVAPFTQTGVGITSFVQQFGIASGLSSSAQYGTSTLEYPNSITSNVTISTSNIVTTNTGSTTICGDLFNNGTLTMSSQSGDNLFVGGNWNRSATGLFNANDRAVTFNGATNTSITANNGQHFPYLYIQKTSSTNKVSLVDSISIKKEFKITTGIFELGNKNVTLLSDNSFTAAFGTLGALGSINYAAGTGRFIAERYINTGTLAGQHLKSWQLLTAPTVGQTIHESWMENAAPTADPYPGFGTQIPGIGGTANGFDQASSLPSIKVFSPADTSWVGSVNSNQPINTNQGYMVFVRGDRSVILWNGAAKPTTLRSKGILQTGDISGPAILPNKFQSIANPYASTVNYNTLTKSGLTQYIYMFDPTLGGLQGVGGFQTIEVSNGNATPGFTTDYDNTRDYRNIQSGQAFFVRATGSAGSILFKESDKLSESRIATRATNNISTGSYLTANLFFVNGSARMLSDGNNVRFDDTFYNDVDENDAVKFKNAGDNFGLKRNNVSLSIESRKMPVSSDTVFYNLSVSRLADYEIVLLPQNLYSTGLSAELVDKYLNVRTPVNLTDTSFIFFTVNADVNSKMADRFMLVFGAVAGPLPVNFTSITATNNGENKNLINWKVQSEININKYEIERSVDGRNFSKIGETNSILNNGTSAEYFYTDYNFYGKVNFYRIKAISQNGQVQYSSIVKVISKNEAPFISVYPNPVVDGKLQILFKNKPEQKYTIQLFNNLGQKVFNSDLNILSGNQVCNIDLNPSLPKGVYQLKISSLNYPDTIISVNIEE